MGTFQKVRCAKKRAWVRLELEFKAKKAAMDRDSKAVAAPADPAVAALRQQQLDLFGSMELEPDRPLGDGDGELARFRRVRRERLEQCANPLQWWARHQGEFPVLAQLARKFLCIMPSSASIERVFSTGGNAVSKKKCSPVFPFTRCPLVKLLPDPGTVTTPIYCCYTVNCPVRICCLMQLPCLAKQLTNSLSLMGARSLLMKSEKRLQRRKTKGKANARKRTLRLRKQESANGCST